MNGLHIHIHTVQGLSVAPSCKDATQQQGKRKKLSDVICHIQVFLASVSSVMKTG